MTRQSLKKGPHAEGLRVAANIALAGGISDLVSLTVEELCAIAGASTESFYAEFGSTEEFQNEFAARLLDARIMKFWGDDVPPWHQIEMTGWPEIIHDLADTIDTVDSRILLGAWAWTSDPSMREAVWARCRQQGVTYGALVTTAREHFGWALRIDDSLFPTLVRHIRDAGVVSLTAHHRVTWSDVDNVERSTSLVALVLRGLSESLLCGPDDEPYVQTPRIDDHVQDADDGAPSDLREQFLQVALAADFPDPFASLTSWQIASKAGISPSTLSHHFVDNADLHQQVYAEVASRLETEASEESLSRFEQAIFETRGEPSRGIKLIAAFASETTKGLAADPSFTYFVAGAGIDDVAAIRRKRQETAAELRSALGSTLRLALAGTELDPTGIDRDLFYDVVVAAVISGAMHRYLGHNKPDVRFDVDGVDLDLAGVSIVGTLRLLIGSSTPITRTEVIRDAIQDDSEESVYRSGMAAAAAIVLGRGPSEIVPLSILEVCRAAKTGSSSFYRVFGSADEFRAQSTVAVVDTRLRRFEQYSRWSERPPVTAVDPWPDAAHRMISIMRAELQREAYLGSWCWIARPEVLETVREHVDVSSERYGHALVAFFKQWNRRFLLDSTTATATFRQINDADVLLRHPSPSIRWHDEQGKRFETSLHHLLFYATVVTFTELTSAEEDVDG